MESNSHHTFLAGQKKETKIMRMEDYRGIEDVRIGMREKGRRGEWKTKGMEDVGNGRRREWKT
jgi:hypothetical protein